MAQWQHVFDCVLYKAICNLSFKSDLELKIIIIIGNEGSTHPPYSLTQTLKCK